MSKKSLEALPESLQKPVAAALERLSGSEDLPQDSVLLAELPYVWACSDFVCQLCLRQPALLHSLSETGDLYRKYDPAYYAEALSRQLAEIDDEDSLHRCLRSFRHREMLRIAWRDLTGQASLDETLSDLSTLADALIDGALRWLHGWFAQKFGRPISRTGTEIQLIVLGMGKLGGQELNFSSDIDLIFVFPEAGQTDGEKPIENEQFFIRLGQALIAALDRQTADGQCFRVDMRLRPHGESGPLVVSVAAMERYFLEQGREWERYAMIKARPVAGDLEGGEALLAGLSPFVYRRYFDYGALESLREMKAMIAREVKRRRLADNVKLGRGGIREIEFIAQAFQLIRGGQDPALQQRALQPVLTYLGDHGLLPEHARQELAQSYQYLRRLENRIQAMHDRQSHDLPADPLDRDRLTLAMHAEDWSALCEELDDWRRRVQGHFDQIFVAPQQEDEAEPTGESEYADIWHDVLDHEVAVAVLEAAGFTDPNSALYLIGQFRTGTRVRALSDRGRTRLNRLMPMLLAAVAAFASDRIQDAETLLIAFNGEVWSGGFDLPFLRSRYAARGMAWPFDVAYADVLPVISDRFNTTVDGEEQRGLAAVYELLGDGSHSDIDPFEDSAAAVTAFEDGRFGELVLHNVADVLRTQALGAITERYCGKAEFNVKSLTATRKPG